MMPVSGYRYKLYNFDLSTAATNMLLETGGGYLFVKDATDGTAYIDVKLNTLQNDAIRAQRKTSIRGQFHRLYLDWPAQAGKTMTLLVSSREEDLSIDESAIQDVGIVSAPTLNVNVVSATPVPIYSAVGTNYDIYNVTCTVAGVEYGQYVTYRHEVTVKARGGPLQLAYYGGTTGTAYIYLADGQGFTKSLASPISSTLTAYFQSPVAGTVAEVIAF